MASKHSFIDHKLSLVKAFLVHKFFPNEIDDFLEYTKLFEKYASERDRNAVYFNTNSTKDGEVRVNFTNLIKQNFITPVIDTRSFTQTLFNCKIYLSTERLLVMYSEHSDCGLAFKQYVRKVHSRHLHILQKIAFS